MKKVYIFFILYFIIISNCEYFTLMSKKEWEKNVDKEDDIVIYISGAYQSASGDIVPCYWKIKNNKIKQVDLEYDIGTNNNVAYSIYVLNDKVYSCGCCFDTAYAETRACYWINSKKHDFFVKDPSIGSIAFSIKVKNGVLFTTGVADSKAQFWTNDYKYDLSIETARTIFIQQNSSGKHLILIGGLSTNDKACYWKDDDSKINELPPSLSAGDSSEVWSIYTIGNNIYCAGMKTISSVTEACLWINNDLNVLSNGSYAYSVFVSNEDVYVSGETTGTNACYWKNKNFHALPYLNSPSKAYSIFAHNDKAYIAGYDSDGGGNYKACYWINNEQIYLDSTSINSMAYSIFITNENQE